MRSITRKVVRRGILASLLIGTIIGAFGVVSHAAGQSGQKATQKTFATPDQAAQALIQAVEAYEVPALIEILGPDGKDLVTSEDPVEDKNRATAFAALAREKVLVSVDPKNPHRAEVSVGKDDWPLPIPLVSRNGQWYFDTKSGRQQILFRRIGENELTVINICRGFDEAQHEYAAEKHDGSKVNQFAQRIISTPGKQDGLAWQNGDGTWGGPVGETIAKAIEQGYALNGAPFNGYHFKILKAQGPAAPLGELDFVVNGLMIGGFALAAAPAQYKVTGVETFIVGWDGVVYQKDLGPDTAKIFKNMERYNPDKTWRATDDESQ